MSRNAQEGTVDYFTLYNMGVEIIFLKEPHINSRVYDAKMNEQISHLDTGNPATDKLVNGIISALHDYMIEVASEQIRIAFEQAEKEVTDLHQRVSEGLTTAKLNGKHIGREEGRKYPSKKSEKCKNIIIKCSRDFGGNMNDKEVMAICGISRNTFYLYKRELHRDISAD